MQEKEKKSKKKDKEKENLEEAAVNQATDNAEQEASEVKKEDGETEVLKKRVAELEAELEKQSDLFKRTVAEYDNYRKRTAREMGAISKEVKAETLKELLPIVDNIERAVSVQEGAEADIRKGVEMVAAQIISAFTKLGVEAIDQTGVDFDPEVHNAVMHVEDESLDENTVTEMLQKGYKLGDKVLRHAMVKVAN